MIRKPRGWNCPHCGALLYKPFDGRALASPERVFEAAADMIPLEREEIHVFLLDSKHRIRRRVRVAAGGRVGAQILCAEVFTEAVRDAAVGVIVVHNHPTGDPGPSGEDRALTAAMVKAGEVLRIPVRDHVIVGADGWFSFANEGAAIGNSLADNYAVTYRAASK